MVSNNNRKTNVSLPTGMLSSPHIAYCFDEYGIVKDYEKSCIASAAYHMRLGGHVLTWNQGKKIEFELGEKEDKNQNIRTSVDLLPNSLTFLTSIEEFRLTKDIIARFNLKSKWVHQGLLLGTGPIVDPQLHARLLIPVHNFSSQTITINFKEQFISVEFTKTLDPDDELQLDSGTKTKYVENENWDYNFLKYRERIANKRVESSVQSQFEKSRKNISEAEVKISGQTRLTNYSIVGTIFAVFALILTTWSLIESTRNKADDAYNLVKQYRENGVDFRSFALKSSYDDLEKDISGLRINNNALRADQKTYQREIKTMLRRIDELEKSRE